MNNKWHLVIVLAVSLCVHLAFYGRPAQVVFDEVHFGEFVSNYYDGDYFFDIHPPLGKLLIAGFADLFDFKPEYSFSEIGNEFPDKKYLALRFLPTLAGIIFPLIIYLILLELGMSGRTALAGGIIISLENALLVESRFILMDMFLILFGFSALLMYLKYHKSGFIKYLFLAGLLGTLSFSIKWTGISFLALPALFETIKSVKIKSFYLFSKAFVFLAILPLIIYFSIFAVHFSILKNSGPGDDFMSPGFQKTLIGSTYEKFPEIEPKSLVEKFSELNYQMYTSNQRLDAEHPYASSWYSWPFMARSIYFWTDSANSPQTQERIYLLGNPVIWWLSTVAVASFLIFLITRQEKLTWLTAFLATGYLSNILPFIGVKRVMFLYHYLPALIFSVIILLYLIDKHKKYRLFLNALLISSLIVFLYFAPLSYGLPLSEEGFEHRIWFDGWE